MTDQAAPVDIAGRPIGPGEPCLVIAEAGVNHDGDLDRARQLVEAAADAGADAVKFQTFLADRLVARGASKAEYQLDAADDGESQFEMLRRLELDQSAHRELDEYCQSTGIDFLSSAFDPESADLLDALGVPAIKLGSGELTNLPLLTHVARLDRPMVLSTGMATMAEVEAALEAVRKTNPDVELALLHCTSTYPAELGEVNLRAMQTMIEDLTVPIGYSDHTLAVETPGFAVAAGARIVEKHFTLDRTLPGPDHGGSLEPPELTESVRIARDAATSRGSAEKGPVESEKEMRTVARKSLRAAVDIPAGRTLERHMLTIKRPADGLPPAELCAVIGRSASRRLEADDPITEAVLSPDE